MDQLSHMHIYWKTVLLELFTMTHLSWVALHDMDHSFFELYNPFCHNKAVIHEGDTGRYQNQSHIASDKDINT